MSAARDRNAVLARGVLMPVRHLQKIALALVTAAACTTPDRGSANDTTASRARADTSPVTTHEMAVALTRDVSASDRGLSTAEDSIYLFMVDTAAALLKQS